MKGIKNIGLVLLSIIVGILLFEIAVRLLIKPSSVCYGSLFQAELPPFKLDLARKFHAHYDQPLKEVDNDGKVLTKGDLWGILEEDEVLGYVPAKNAISKRGWWQSNNLGARARTDITFQMPQAKKRILLFGDSYTNGSRVSLEESWPYYLNDKNKTAEFLNFGVDGYSMGQSLLRYEGLRGKIEYSSVVTVFVPSLDLWRDVNVLRQLNNWQNYPLLPRFELEEGQLRLIRSPYGKYDDFSKDNHNRLSERLKKYLRAHDRFYSDAKYDLPVFWGELVVYKLIARSWYVDQNKRLWANILSPDSEAMQVSLKIFERFNVQAKQDGGKFILVCLPTAGDVVLYRKDPIFRKKYDAVVMSIKETGIQCIDLMTSLLAKNITFDTGKDRTHYGPKTNKIIAELLLEQFHRLGLV